MTAGVQDPGMEMCVRSTTRWQKRRKNPKRRGDDQLPCQRVTMFKINICLLSPPRNTPSPLPVVRAYAVSNIKSRFRASCKNLLSGHRTHLFTDLSCGKQTPGGISLIVPGSSGLPGGPGPRHLQEDGLGARGCRCPISSYFKARGSNPK